MASPKQPKTYQAMADELDRLVACFESDQVDLDKAVTKYRQALELLAEMEKYLKTAENQVKKIAVKFDQG